MNKIMARVKNNETWIWNTLIHEKETVSQEQYETLAKTLPKAFPAGSMVRNKGMQR